jgi:predicted nucleic acid-binding protein
LRARIEELTTDQLFLSVLTIGEIAKGIALLDAGEHRRRLSLWLLTVENQYAGNILPVDIEVARFWGETTARAQATGITIPAGDGLIAATALRHGMHVITRNTRHFHATGVTTINPWE